MSSETRGSRRKFVIGALIIVLLGAVFVVWQRSGREDSGDGVIPAGGTVSAEVAMYQKLCKGKEAAEKGRHAEALALFEEIVRNSTNASYKWDADIQAALAMGNLKQTQDAVKRLDRIIAACPLPEEIPNAQLIKAEVLSSDGQHELAIRLLDELVSAHTDLWSRMCEEALVFKAGVHQQLGQIGLTRATLDRISLDYPGAEDIRRQWADKHAELLTDKHRLAQEDRIKKTVAEKGAILLDKIAEGDTKLSASRLYIVTESLVVSDKTRLWMEPGTEIQFGVRGGFVVKGKFEALGSSDKRITMTSLGGDPDRDWWAGIQFAPAGKDSTCLLDSCRIAGAEIALETLGGTAEVSNCVFDRCGRVTIKVGKGSNVSVKSCQIEQARRVGIEAERTSTLTMQDCRITDAVSHGLFLQETAPKTRIQRATVERCGRHGILLRGQCSPAILDCRISGNRVNGIAAIEGASPIVVKTVCDGNGENGIHIRDKARLQVESSALTGNKRNGLLAEGRCPGRISANRMERNGEHGLVLRLDCTPEVTHNLFAGNGRLGVLLQNSQPALLRDNAFEKNGAAGLRNEGPGRVQAAGNWWAATDEQKVSAAIEDQADDAKWGGVDYAPWLRSPPGLPTSTEAK